MSTVSPSPIDINNLISPPQQAPIPPAPWTANWDNNSNQYYFYNPTTGESSWAFPTTPHASTPSYAQTPGYAPTPSYAQTPGYGPTPTQSHQPSVSQAPPAEYSHEKSAEGGSSKSKFGKMAFKAGKDLWKKHKAQKGHAGGPAGHGGSHGHGGGHGHGEHGREEEYEEERREEEEERRSEESERRSEEESEAESEADDAGSD